MFRLRTILKPSMALSSHDTRQRPLPTPDTERKPMPSEATSRVPFQVRNSPIICVHLGNYGAETSREGGLTETSVLWPGSDSKCTMPTDWTSLILRPFLESLPRWLASFGSMQVERGLEALSCFLSSSCVVASIGSSVVLFSKHCMMGCITYHGEPSTPRASRKLPIPRRSPFFSLVKQVKSSRTVCTT